MHSLQNPHKKDPKDQEKDSAGVRVVPQTKTPPREKEVTAICPKCFKPHQAIHSLHGIQLLGCPMIEDDAVIFL